MAKLNLDVQLSAPEDGVGWIVRVDVPGRGTAPGFAEGDDLGTVFKDALLCAFVPGFEPEENRAQ